MVEQTGVSPKRYDICQWAVQLTEGIQGDIWSGRGHLSGDCGQ